jgi:hypothetical protein
VANSDWNDLLLSKGKTAMAQRITAALADMKMH